MRLHHLEITAFGPFAEHRHASTSTSSPTAGLFLLSGATGAGKTSVLDAVCFALYGDVPGDRNAAKRLRSDQAAPGVAPRVALEATLVGPPVPDRPLPRLGAAQEARHRHHHAAGLRHDRRASVDGAWVPLSSRLDETGHLVTGLVGMNVTQFTQVAMLPQGRFQAFLRARSEERHKLLQQLFRTGRFEDVERWLRDRRVALRRRSEAAHRGSPTWSAGSARRPSSGLPDGWDIRDLHAPAGSGELLAWAEDLRAGARPSGTAADGEAADAADTEHAARTDLEQAARRSPRAGPGWRPRRAELAGLAEATAQHERRPGPARRRPPGGRGRPGAPDGPGRRRRAARAARSAEEAAAAAADELGLLLVDRRHPGPGRRGRRRRRRPRAGAAAPRARGARPRRGDRAAAPPPRASRRAPGRRSPSGAPPCPSACGALRADLEQARAAALAVAGVESRLADVRRRLDAAEQVRALGARLEVAEAELRVTAAARHPPREQWLDLREARLDGMAAEIAGALAVGACCPVCGSAEHPQKARGRRRRPRRGARRRRPCGCSTTPSPRSRRTPGWSVTSPPGWRWPASTPATRRTTCCAAGSPSCGRARRAGGPRRDAGARPARLEATEAEPGPARRRVR